MRKLLIVAAVLAALFLYGNHKTTVPGTTVEESDATVQHTEQMQGDSSR